MQNVYEVGVTSLVAEPAQAKATTSITATMTRAANATTAATTASTPTTTRIQNIPIQGAGKLVERNKKTRGTRTAATSPDTTDDKTA